MALNTVTGQQAAGFTARTDIRDIKGPVWFPPGKWPYITGGLLLALLVIYLAVRAVKGMARKTAAPVKKELPHETALRMLEALEKKSLIRAGRVDEYFTELSIIIRRYIEDRFEISAPEMTTEEFLVSVKTSRKLGYTQKGLLKDFLSFCDMVKFARYGPMDVEIRQSSDAARKFVHETRPDNQGLPEI